MYGTTPALLRPDTHLPRLRAGRSAEQRSSDGYGLPTEKEAGPTRADPDLSLRRAPPRPQPFLPPGLPHSFTSRPRARLRPSAAP